VLPQVPVKAGASNGNVADLEISFHDVPLKALSPPAFARLFAGVTLLKEVDVIIKGTADVVARTAVGDIPITGISFNAPSSLNGKPSSIEINLCSWHFPLFLGINSFEHTTALIDVVIRGSGGAGGDEFILATLSTSLENLSNISLSTVGISLPVIYEDVTIGRAVIPVSW